MNPITRLSNTVVFDLPTRERLALRLTSPWIRSVGMGPDVNVAIVSWKEWESIGDTSARLIGDVKFFYSQIASNVTLPDVILHLQEIIDVSPEGYGQRADLTKPRPTNTATLAVEITSYKIVFADIRHRFAAPFGGRVVRGELNKTPLTAGGSLDANGNRLYNPLEMAKECMLHMGLNYTYAPNSLSDYPKLFDVQWRGNHAPTELEKILGFCQHTPSVSAAGHLLLHEIGKGDRPVIPPTSQVAVLPFAAIERRGGAIVLTSAPNANLETKTIVGPYDENGDESWQFVVQDAVGQWHTYYDVPYWRSESEAMARFRTFADGFDASGTPLPFYVQDEMFRCIRLNPDKYGPSPIDRKVLLDKYGTPVDLSLTAKTATSSDYAGTYSNSTDFKPMRLYGIYDEGRVIHSADILVQVDAPSLDFHSHAKLIGNNDLKVRCTREVYIQDETSQWVPQYYEIGYRQVLGRIEEVTGDALKNLIDSGTAPIIRVPKLRLITVDGINVNESEVKAEARNRAGNLLSGSGDPAEQHVAKGFLAGDLNGLINRIEYHQDDVRTVFHLNTFFLPSSEALPRYQAVDAQKSSQAYPKESEVAGSRTSAGLNGHTQQTAMIQSWPPRITPPGMVKVKITDVSSAGRGKYNGGIVGGTSTADESSPLREPEGMTDPATTDVLICNLAEDFNIIGSTTKPDHMLPPGYYFGKVVGGGSNGATVEIDSTRCGSTKTKNLQHLDGAESPYEDSAEGADRQSVQVTLLCRLAYNAAGGKSLYGFYRTFTLDCGKVTNIGRESKVTIFTTGACT